MNQKIKKLHLGCGNRFIDGFVHIDLNNADHIDYVSSLDKLEFLDDNSVSEIYCSHALEYYDRFEAGQVIAEWQRTLVPGGKIYISVPDFAALVKIYGMTQDIENIIGPLFGRWKLNDEYIYHRTCWDFKSLSRILKALKFHDIKTFKPEEYLSQYDTNYDDYSLAYFPHKLKSGIQVSLAIEATK